MAKNRIEVQLGFSADTANAQRQIEQLGKTLNSITSGQALNISEGWTKELSEGVTAANKLKVALSNAVNVNTGKLDLGKFQQTLKQSGMSLANYREQLASLGTVGQDAFMQLTRSIINAEAPVFRVSNALKKMGTTLMNTMRWQLSASLIQGFTGAIQDAVDYAQDLNESLNDIRIVTGYNVDKMDEFAIKANKAAKALSTTTNEYAKASLIYFQQGLNDKQVEERANTTVKLANVTGESAETVSEWMTAVWNNFDNGSKSLEYYADVMTALGAATASSSDEIAQGLEKFAAISNTIGLSYEYAASALATVTSQTRQSADIVGTAFKTIFGRMEGLTLGETLDDGTNLNKYSESLKTVGVDILNANNELKSMDTILNELGQRWGTLSQAQKVALAQTVGGMRQYNQLIALMDNWDYFQQNLEMSLSSSGTLEEQANIYAESWEAARDRVTAAAETLYDKLLNDEGFIKILGFFEDFLGLVDKAVDSMGGLQGVIALAGTALMTMLSPQITKGLETLGLNLMMMTPKGREKVNSLKTQALEDLVGGDGSTASKTPNDLASGSQARHDVASKIGTLEKYYNENQNTMTDFDQQVYRAEIDGIDNLSKKYIELADQHDILTSKRERFKAQGEDLTEVDKELANVESDLSDVQDALGNRVNEVANNMRNATPRTLSWAEGLTMAAQAAFQISFAISSFENILTVWNDDTLTGWEKFKSILTSISFIIPSLLSLYKTFNSEIIISTLNKIKETIVTKQQQKEELKLAAAKKASSSSNLSSKSLVDKIKEFKDYGGIKGWYQRRAYEKNTGNVTLLKDFNGKKVVQGAAPGKSSGIAIGQERFQEEARIYTEKLKGNFISGLKNIGKGVLAAAAIAATIIAIKMLIDWYNRFDKAAERTSKYAQAQAEAFDKVKQANEELKQSISSYEKGVEGLKELTRGTSEYKQAVLEANEQALELIKNNESLAGKYNVNEEGLIEFSENALEEASLESQNKLIQQQNASIMAQQTADKSVQQKKEINFLRDDVKSGSDTWSKAGNSSAGMVAGGAIGASLGVGLGLAASFIPIVGPLITATVLGVMATSGAVLGAAAGTAFGATSGVASNKEKEAIEDLQQEYKRLAEEKGDGSSLFIEGEIRSFLETQGYSENLIKALEENSDELKELIESNYQLEEQIKTQNKLLVSNKNSSNDNYNNSYYKPVLEAAAAARINTDSQEYKDEFEKTEKELRKWYSTDKKVFEAYVKEVLGAEFDVSKEGAYRVKSAAGENGKLQIYQDGAWVDFGEISKDDAISQIVQNKLAQLSDEDIAKIEKESSYIDKNLQNSGLMGDKNTEARIDIIAQIASGRIENLSKLNAEGVETLLQVIEEIYGTSAIDSLKVQDAINRKERDLDDVEEQFKYPSLLNLNKITNREEATVEEYKTIAELLSSVSETLGLGGENLLVKGLQGYDTNIQAAISEVLASFNNWESPYALELLQQALEDAEIFNVDLTSEAWQTLIAQMTNSAAAVKNTSTEIDNLYKSITSLKDIVKNLTLGDIITKEQYDTLKATNPLIEDYFYKVANGYQLINENLNTEALLNDEYYNSLLLRAKSADDIIKASKSFIQNNDSVWNNYQNTFENKSGISQNFDAYRNLLSGLSDEIFEGIGISQYDAFWADSDERRLEILTKIEDLFKSVINEEYSAETFLATYINDRVWSLQELTNITQQYGDIGKKVYDNYYKLIERRQIQLEVELKSQKLLNREIENYQKAIDKINTNSSRAYGAAKIQLLQQESSLYDDINLKNENLIKIYQERIKYEQDNSIYSKWLTFDKDSGEITNINTSWINTEEDRKNFEDFINTYNGFLDQVYDTTEAIAENIRQKLDTKLERLQYAVDIEIKLHDEDLEKLEKEFDRLDDKAFSAAEKINNIASQLRILDNKKEVYKEAYLNNQANILKEYGVSSWEELMAIEGINQEEIISQLEKDVEALEEIEQTLYDMDKLMADTLLNSFKEFGEAFDKINEKASGLKAIVDSYKNIVSLTRQFTNIDSELIKKMNETSVAIAQNQMKTSKAKYDSLKQERDNALAMFNEAIANNDMGTADYWKKQLEEINSMVDKAQQDFMSSWENALQVAADAYKNTIEETIRDFEKSQTGLFGSYDSMLEYYDQQTKLQDLYLKDYERIYELSKLNRKVMKDIDETDSVAAKKELRKLQAEINELQNSNTEMSQYDLEYLQKKYDLRVAEIALEEAQRAKNQVQLVRNAAGGWGYVYTADQNNIEDAEQKYEDKLFELQDYSMNYMDQIGREVVALQQEYIQKIQEVYNSGLSGEQLQAALDNVNKYYGAQLEAASKEYDKTVTNHNELVKNITATASDTGALMVAGEDFVKKFEDTIVAKLGYGTVNGENGSLGSMHKNIREFVNSVISESDDGLLTKLQSGYQRFQEQCDRILQQAGTDFNELGQTINSAIGTDSIGIIGKLSELDSATQELQNNMSNHMANILEEAESWGSNMSDIYWDVVEAANAAAAALAEARAAAAAGLPEVPETPKQNENKEKDKNDNATTQDDLIEKTKKEIANGMWDMDANRTPSNPDSPEEAIEDDFDWDAWFTDFRQGQENTLTELRENLEKIHQTDLWDDDHTPETVDVTTPQAEIQTDNITIISSSNSIPFNNMPYLNPNASVAQFDTGGYTGSWGPSARLALLDEKELVLDKYDTANFLTALGVLDSILETINLNVVSSSLGSPNVRSANVNNVSNNLEQKVTIHAEFPYATDRNEIQEAFNNLINTASQYANRK